VRVVEGLQVVLLRVSAAAVLSLLVRREELMLLLRRRALYPILLLLLPLLGEHGLWVSAVGVSVSADLGEVGQLPLGNLQVLLAYRRLFPVLVVAFPPLSPPPRRNAPFCCRRSGRRVPPRYSRASDRVRGP